MDNMEKIGGWTEEFVVRTLAFVRNDFIDNETIKIGSDKNTNNYSLILHFINDAKSKSLRLEIDLTCCEKSKQKTYDEIFDIAKKTILENQEKSSNKFPQKNITKWKTLMQVSLLEGQDYFNKYSESDEKLKNFFETEIENIIKKYNNILDNLLLKN